MDVRGVIALLQVYDMRASIHFYRDVLGFDIVSTSPVLGKDRFHWALLRLGTAEIMLNTAYECDSERPPAPDARRVAAHDDTGLYFTCPDVDAVYERFRKSGAPVNPPVTAPYGMRQVYLHDPDRYSLCFQWPDENGREISRPNVGTLASTDNR